MIVLSCAQLELRFLRACPCELHIMSEVDGVVFGAGGGVGFECVQHLLDKGKSVRAVVRSPEKYKDKFPKNPLLTVAQGGKTVECGNF